MFVLITGGPVHGKLDDVKIVTNRFKGGQMAALATSLAEKLPQDVQILYLTAQGVSVPVSPDGRIQVIYHDGIFDYYNKVLQLVSTPEIMAVILGAAVANLVPQTPFPGKFPSHQYNSGDIIPIPFILAPRVITAIHRQNPAVKLFGFKLLSDVPTEQLVDVAHELCLETHATAIIANDNKNLSQKYVVTKEKSIIPLHFSELPAFLADAIQDTYFSTVKLPMTPGMSADSIQIFNDLLAGNSSKFVEEHGLLFGSIAVRTGPESFIATIRGKTEAAGFSFVEHVNQDTMKIYATEKATLNAPLLAKIFRERQDVKAIIHLHDDNPQKLDERLYAFPGTLRDCNRSITGSFYIQNHGSYYLLDEKMEMVPIYRPVTGIY